MKILFLVVLSWLSIGFVNDYSCASDKTDVLASLDDVTRQINEVDRRYISYFVSPEVSDFFKLYVEGNAVELDQLTAVQPVSQAKALKDAKHASIVMIGDTHNIDAVQRKTEAIIDYLVNSNDRPKLFVFELIDAAYQQDLEAYYSGQITADQLYVKVKWNENIGYAWDSYLHLLDFLRDRKVRVKFVLRNDLNWDIMDLKDRDAYTLSVIKDEVARVPDLQVILLHGNAHLLGSVGIAQSLEEAFPKKTVRLLTGLPRLYWQLVDQGYVFDSSTYVRLSGGIVPNTYYMFTAIPDGTYSFFTSLADVLTNDDALKNQLKSVGGTAATSYRQLNSETVATNYTAAKKALTSYNSAVNQWVDLILTKTDDPKKILPEFGKWIEQLRRK